MRQLNPHVRLYTEMITAAALLHGDAEKLLVFDPIEHPVALQIGGSEPQAMAAAARLGAEAGYDEINVNVGCPSERVQSGAFGACLMAEPATVAACLEAMQAETDLPVTVKTRIGIDDQDSIDFLYAFVEAVRAAGCRRLIVHARKAFLKGLSPKENRTVPPLNYPRVYRLKADFPDLDVVVNGGITTREACIEHLRQVDGVMVGRQAYQNPWFLTELDTDGGAGFPKTRAEVVAAMQDYAERELARGSLLKHITRHMLGLYAGQPGARRWRRYLSEHAHQSGAGPDVLQQALHAVPEAA